MLRPDILFKPRHRYRLILALMKMHRDSKPRFNICLFANYEAEPFRHSHAIFEYVRIRSRDGAVASAMSRNMVAINREAAAVYLLDDDASILKATRRLLDSAGWNNVEIFTDPNVFLQRAARDRPDLAVIDMRMPAMNGLEVQTRLRRVSPSTRVILLTANDDPSIRQIAMTAGAFAFFIKGVESGDFLAGVKAAANSVN